MPTERPSRQHDCPACRCPSQIGENPFGGPIASHGPDGLCYICWHTCEESK